VLRIISLRGKFVDAAGSLSGERVVKRATTTTYVSKEKGKKAKELRNSEGKRTRVKALIGTQNKGGDNSAVYRLH